MTRLRVVSLLVLLVAFVALASGCASSSDKAATSGTDATGTVATVGPPAGQIAYGRVMGVEGGPSMQGGKPYEGAIFVVNSDGSGLATLAVGPGQLASDPTWSPDGTRIAYGSNTGSVYDNSKFEIFAINSDGSKRVQLTRPPVSAYWPAWSPDGVKIAFGSYDYATSEIHIAVMNADGSRITTVTTGDSEDSLPAWAPDGRRIFFLRGAPAGMPSRVPLDLFVVNSDGTGLVQLTKTGTIGSFSVSPDGSKIAFFDTGSRRMMLMPSDASAAPTVLVDHDFKTGNVASTWAPDGSALALGLGGADLGAELYTVNADGSNLLKVPNVTYAVEPAWRPE